VNFSVLNVMIDTVLIPKSIYHTLSAVN